MKKNLIKKSLKKQVPLIINMMKSMINSKLLSIMNIKALYINFYFWCFLYV